MFGGSNAWQKAVEEHKESYDEQARQDAEKAAETVRNTPLTDEQKERIYSSPTVTYNVVDSNGNITGQVSGSEDIYNAAKNHTVGSFDVGSKTFTPTSANVSIELNEDTGDITINAPQSLLDRTEYMDSLLDATKQLSQNYKLNKDYRYTDPSDQNNTISTQEYLQYLQQDAEQQAENALAYDSQKAAHKENGVNLTDDQVIRANAYGAKFEDGTTSEDSTRVAIPDGDAFNFFRELDTYDPETKTAEYGDIKDNAWNRDTHTTDIQGARAAVNDYFEKGDFSDTDQYASMYAFYQFQKGTETAANGAHQVFDFLSDVVTGTVSGFVNGVTGLAAVVEVAGAGNNAKDAAENGLANKIFGETSKWEQSFQTNIESVRGSESGVFAVSNLLGPIAVDLATIPLGGVGMIGLAGQAAKATAKGALKVAGAGAKLTASGVKTALKNVGETIKTANTLNKLVDGEKLVSGLSKANKAISNATKTQALKNAIKVVSTDLTKMGVTQSASKIAKFTSESVIQAVMCDPEPLRDAIISDDKDEISRYVMSNLAVDTLFVGGLKGAGKIGKAVASTTPGQIAHAATTVKLNGFTAHVSSINTKIKDTIYGGDYIKNLGKKISKLKSELGDQGTASGKGKRIARKQKKLEVAEINAQLREARKQLGDMHVTKGTDTLDDVMKNVKKVNEQRVNVMRLNNAIDAAKGGLSRAIREFLQSGSVKFTAADKAVNTLQKEILKAEKKAGMKPRFGKNASDTNRLFSQETVDYLGASEQKKILENKAAAGKLSKEEEKELKDLNKKIENFNKVAPAELKELANRYIEADRKWWAAANDYFASQGLISKEELANLREERQFGENGMDYVRTQRQPIPGNGKSKPKKDPMDKTNQTFDRLDKYKEGATGHFVDPTFVKYKYLYEKAEVKVSRDLMQSGAKACGYSMTTKMNGDKTSLVKTFNDVQKQFKKTIKNTQGSMWDSLNERLDLIVERTNYRKWNSKMGALEKKGEEGTATYTRVPDELQDLTPGARLNTINSLDDESMAQVAKEGAGDANEALESEDAFNEFMEGLPETTKRYMRSYMHKADWFEKKDKRVLTYENFTTASENDPEFIANLNRRVVTDTVSNDALASQEIKRMRDNVKAAENGVLKTMATAKTKKMIERLENEGTPFSNIMDNIDQAINDAYEMALKDKATQALVKKLVALDETISAENVTKYLVISHLNSSEAKKAIIARVKNKFREERDAGVEALEEEGVNLNKEYKEIENGILEIIDDKLDMEMGKASQAISGSDLLDQTVFEKIRKLQKEIGDLNDTRNVVHTMDESGEEVYVETDPLLADLIKNRPNDVHMGYIAKSNYIISKIFRLGQTGLNPASWLTQTIRDAYMLYVGGNAYRGMKQSISAIEEYMPQNVATFMKSFTPEELRSMTSKELAQTELERGAAISPAAVEESAYRFDEAERNAAKMGSNATKSNLANRALDKMGEFFGNITKPGEKKFSKLNPLTWNEQREQMFRRRAYNNGMADALKEGYSLEDARVIAEFLMNNVTTNFNRRLYHLGNLQRTVPYLGAAVNGTKSFYRLFLLDPVGITGRLMAGLCIPQMYLTAESLSSEENRQIYMSIPEYDKKDNLVFVMDGKAYSIAIPQELNSIVAPFRQMVEGMYNSNQHTFWEFAASDLVGLSPIDLTGFVSLDNENCLEDTALGNLQSWFLSGTSRVVSQLATPPLKGAIIGITGYDPYTGRKVDTTYKYTDPITGEEITMGSEGGAFATALGQIFGDSWSPVLADKIIGNIVGVAGKNVLNAVTEWCNLVGTGNGDGASLIESAGEDMIGKLEISVYNSKADRAWNNAVRQLRDQKEEILQDEKYQEDIQALGNTTLTDDAREEIRKRIIDKLTPFQNSVKTAVDNLVDEYSGTFGHKKLSAVISLLNFGDIGGVGSVTSQSISNAQEAQSQGYYSALNTMMKLGFKGTNDSSAFGYYKTDSSDPTGRNAKVVYQNPVSLLAYKNAAYGGGDIHAANITELLKNYTSSTGKTLKELKTERDNAVNAIYDKSSLSTSDYNAIDTLYNNYNKEVVSALANYVKQYSAEAAINNDSVLDVLTDYIKVPSSYMKTKSGSYVSNLGNGNKQDAYKEAYIKHLFNIKDKYGKTY